MYISSVQNDQIDDFEEVRNLYILELYKWNMNRVPVGIFPTLLVLVTSTLLTNSVIAQSSNATNVTDSNSPINPGAGALLKKILNASSFSNIQTISFVPGIEVSGVNVGDSDISVTLKRTSAETGGSNASVPVTVTALRLPGSSIKDVLSLVEASAKLRRETTPGPLAGMMEKMGPLLGAPAGSNESDSIRPLQSMMQLGQNLQMGVGSIVDGDWTTPQTVTTGLLDLGQLFGMGSANPSPNARAHFIMVFVVPYVGKTTFGSVPLK